MARAWMTSTTFYVAVLVLAFGFGCGSSSAVTDDDVANSVAAAGSGGSAGASGKGTGSGRAGAGASGSGGGVSTGAAGSGVGGSGTGGTDPGSGGSQAADAGMAPGCMMGARLVPEGESVPADDGCNTCSCLEGALACTEIRVRTSVHRRTSPRHVLRDLRSGSPLRTRLERMPGGVRPPRGRCGPRTTMPPCQLRERPVRPAAASVARGGR